ncbi:hypothetical protein ACN3E9_04570 [Vibrio pectenicida]|uniref:hypothetical protein n=1 Tax=Vibrio pectenicida TaxID=62763 RepID=UPI003B9B7859
MKRSKFTKIILPVMVTSLLFGCGGGSSGGGVEPAAPQAILTSMTQPRAGYQSMVPADSEATHLSTSDFVLKNLESNDSFNVEFTCINCTSDQVEEMPTITRIYDITKKFTMINMNNSAVEWQGKTYKGNYPLILEKTTGKLYPIIYKGFPIQLDDALQDESPFFSKQKTGTIYPDDVLYSNLMLGKDNSGQHLYERGVFKAIVNDGAVVVSKLVADLDVDERFFIVDKDKNIFAQYPTVDPLVSWHPIYISSNGDVQEMDPEYTTGTAGAIGDQFFEYWRLIDGRISATRYDERGDNGNFYYMSWEGGDRFKTEDSGFANYGRPSTAVEAHISSLLNGFDINSNCFINKFDVDGYKFETSDDTLFNPGYAPYDRALDSAEDSLFCMDYYQAYVDDTDHDGDTVKVFSFNTQTKESYSFDTQITLGDCIISEGDEEFTTCNYSMGSYAVSDDVVMLYVKDHNRVNEYYINPKDNTYKLLEKNNGVITPVGFLSL